MGKAEAPGSGKRKRSAVIFRGSRGGMLRKTGSPVLETRYGGVEEHQPARIRKRNRERAVAGVGGVHSTVEGAGQHNPARGKRPCFVHATKEWRMRGLQNMLTTPERHQDTAEEALPQGQAGTGLPLLRLV